MTGRRVAARIHIKRHPGEVFDWVADYHHVPSVMDGVNGWRPLGAQSEGIGARYRVELSGLASSVGATLVITEWDRPDSIGWASESSPVANQGRWTFKPARDGTDVQLAVRYEPPAGAIGNFLAARVEGVIEGRVKVALRRMKDRLESAR